MGEQDLRSRDIRAQEARLEVLLRDLLGPGRARVFIVAEPKGSPAADVPAAPKTSPDRSLLFDDIQKRLDEAPSVLPGYRLSDGLTAEALRALQDRLPQPPPPPPPKKVETILAVTVFLDPTVEEGDVKRVREAAVQALGLNLYGKDHLSISRVPLRPAWSTLLDHLSVRLAAVRAVVYAAAALLAALLLLPAALILRRGKEPEEEPRVLPESAPPRGSKKREEEAPEPALPVYKPTQVAGAALFLKGENPDAAAWVLRSVGPKTAADIFRRLPGSQQRDVAAALLEEPSPRPPRGVDMRLTERLRGEAGKEELLSEILNRCPEDMRELILSHLQRVKPASQRRVREGLLTMEDLAAADAGSLRIALSTFSTDELALALYDLDEGLRLRLLRALPELIRRRVLKRGEDLVPESETQVVLVRSGIYARWKRLEAGGRVRSLRPPKGPP